MSTPERGRAGPWERAPGRTCRWVALRWDWRRGEDAPRWVVVAYESMTPRAAFEAGDLRVMHDARDEAGARERFASLSRPADHERDHDGVVVPDHHAPQLPGR